MKPILDGIQSRSADQYMIQQIGLPGILLMEQAARACATDILSRYPTLTTCCIVCGPGNNGGDGIALARLLADAGIGVTLIRAFPNMPWKGDAMLEADILQRVPPHHLRWVEFHPDLEIEAQLIIDAVFGTGLDRPLGGRAADIVHWINQQAIQVISIDIPSGLFAESGFIPGPHVIAEQTITFQTFKPVHLVSPACMSCGMVLVRDIGITSAAVQHSQPRMFAIEAGDVVAMLPERRPDSHKGTFGHAFLAGGNVLSPGCMALATQAALAVGAGLVSGLVPGRARSAYFQEGWETMLRGPVADDSAWLDQHHCDVQFLAGTHAIGVGPGLGTGEGPVAFLGWLLRHAGKPLVLDADALNILAHHPVLWERVPPGTIVTPHPGEMQRLQPSPDPFTYRLESAGSLARSRNVVVVLKGHHTLIAFPDGRTFINLTGNPGMATAGSGDVLTGVLTGLLAQGLSPDNAAITGVFLHGLAGDLAAEQQGLQGLRARDILNNISAAIRHLAPQ